METLKKFWHWADNERPSRDVFDVKATAGGPLSEEAQEALQKAVEVVGLRAPDILHPSGEVLRPAIKLLSFAILEAWQMLKDDEQIQTALDVQNNGLLKSDPDYVTKLRLYEAPLQAFRVASAQRLLADPVWLPMDINTYADVPERKPIKDEQETRDKVSAREFHSSIRFTALDLESAPVVHFQPREFPTIVGKAKDIIAQRTAEMKTAGLMQAYGMGPQKLERVLGIDWASEDAADAAGYTAYRTSIPGVFLHSEKENVARHNTGLAVDLNTGNVIVPVIGEMGVTRSSEHERVQINLIKKLIGMGCNEYVSVRVDSRGILLSSREFADINNLVNECQISTHMGDVDEHKLYLVINDLRLRVVEHKRKLQIKQISDNLDAYFDPSKGVNGVRVFPNARNIDGT